MEQTFFEEKEVRVTNARFVVRGQTYAMRNITSVKSSAETADGCLPTALAVMGFILLALGLLVLIGAVLTTLESSLIDSTRFWIAFVLLAVGASTIIAARKVGEPTTYTVILQTSSGEVMAVKDSDGNFVGRIVEAINQAIIAIG